jgi:hypothetical protein
MASLLFCKKGPAAAFFFPWLRLTAAVVRMSCDSRDQTPVTRPGLLSFERNPSMPLTANITEMTFGED